MSILDKLNKYSIIKDVTKSISFDNGHTFEVSDYKLKGMFDDVIYEKNRNLWEDIPRCLCVVKNQGDVIRTICGLRKFGEEGQYKTDIPRNFVLEREVYLNKANGEYCSVSMFEFLDELYFVIRSKNVSMILRKEKFMDDLITYTEPRYEYAVEMADTFYKLYTTLDLISTNKIDDRLLLNTINMEFCSPKYQHLVDYYGKNQLLPFAITSYHPSNLGLTSILPFDAQNWFYKVGLGNLDFMFNVDIDKNNESERNRIRDKIFNEDNSEGAVVYQIYKNIATGEERVLHIYKYKNYKYIFWRAVRERMRTKSTISRLINRLNNLHVTVSNLEEMIDKAIKFYAFCWFSTNHDEYDTIFSRWVNKRNDFLKQSDDVINDYLVKFKNLDASRQQQQIISIGFPGSGKTTLLKCIENIIPNSIRVNQDECNKSSKIYHKRIGKVSKNYDIKVMLLDKCYHNAKVRKVTYNCIDVQQVVYLVFYHPLDTHFNESGNLVIDGFDNMIKLTKERINKRGDGHLNLYPNNKLDSIISGFKDSFEYLTDEEYEMATKIIYVDVTHDVNSQLKHILNELNIDVTVESIKESIKESIIKVDKDEETLRNKISSIKKK